MAMKIKFTRSDIDGIQLHASGPGIRIQATISPDYRFPPVEPLIEALGPSLAMAGYRLERVKSADYAREAGQAAHPEPEGPAKE